MWYRTGALAQALGASARIGIAGVDQQRSYRARTRQMFATDLHGCGAESILGEDTGNRCPLVKQDDCQVFAMELADARLGDAKSDAVDRIELGRIGGEVHGHVTLSIGLMGLARPTTR